jgi:hypothetical protein
VSNLLQEFKKIKKYCYFYEVEKKLVYFEAQNCKQFFLKPLINIKLSINFIAAQNPYVKGAFFMVF